MLVSNDEGGYSFLKGIAPYSSGVAANPGFRIERARFLEPLPIDESFSRIDKYLDQIGRPVKALCGMELRLPAPLSFKGFDEFNSSYIEFLKERKVFIDGINPVARTNVAPELPLNRPAEPVVHAFSYTIPSNLLVPSFIVAGTGELPEGSLNPEEIVRPNQFSADAIAEKASFVVDVIGARLLALQVEWKAITAINIYTIHNIYPFLATMILPSFGENGHAVTWHYTRPPIADLDYEMDVHGCSGPLVLLP